MPTLSYILQIKSKWIKDLTIITSLKKQKKIKNAFKILGWDKQDTTSRSLKKIGKIDLTLKHKTFVAT